MTTIFPLAFVFLALFGSSLGAGTTTGPRAGTTSSICPSRTVNYITHGLAQQCLTSARSPVLNTSILHELESKSTLLIQPSLSESNVSASTQVFSTNQTSSAAAEGPATIQPKSSPISVSSSVAVLPEPPIQPTNTPEYDDTDTDSALENAKFLSFEDWRKQNLLKAGQPEHLGDNGAPEQREPRKRPAGLHNELDSIGDDAEIDLDFTGFVPTGPDLASAKQTSSGGQGGKPIQDAGDKSISRSKDAGTTSKERFNFASFDCAANVLKTNKQAKSPSAVLGENKDNYMLNECSAGDKFLILELCSDIKIDTIVIANFEFFSSTFRTFRVSVSDEYPVKLDRWKTLGIFEARNTREVQAFLVEDPVAWTRFVRIEFLTHFGSEFYCPVSLVRVHGITMLEEWRLLNRGRGEDDEEVVNDAAQPNDGENFIPEALADVLIEEQTLANARDAEEAENQTLIAELAPELQTCFVETQVDEIDCCKPLQNSTSKNRALILYPSLSRAQTVGSTSPASFSSSETQVDAVSKKSSQSTTTENSPKTSPAGLPKISTTMADVVSSMETTGSSETSSNTPSSSTPKLSSSVPSSSNATSERSKSSASSTQSAPPVPTMQESFFKSVQKRLQLLETSSSLSLQYIEEQSRALRDAFSKVEQRQLTKTSTFLDYLNTTVLSELRDFRQQYDQLWQSTVIELEIQREQFQSETIAINTRLGVLADEVIFQKRMAILQMVLVLVCLGLILFSRGPMNNYLELPIVQSMLARSPSSRWMTLNGLETPSQSPAISRPSSSHQMKPDRGILKGHHRSLSEDSANAATSPTDIYSPLTPPSYEDSSDNERRERSTGVDDPLFDPAEIERPSTSPPVLPGGDATMTPEVLPALGDQSESIHARLLDSPPPENPTCQVPQIFVEDPTSQSKHLTWQLPEE